MAKILIVDDSALARKLLRKIIVNIGHEVIAEASSGELAVAAYTTVRPDMVTMDLEMSGIGGLEAADQIKKEHPSAKIVIVSAHEINDLAIEMKKYGLKYSVNKPVTEKKMKDIFLKITSEEKNENQNKDTHKEEKTNDKSTSPHEAIETNRKVLVGHYTRLHPFNAYADEFVKDMATIKINDEPKLRSFAVGEPMILGYEQEGELFLYGCTIVSLDTDNNLIKVSIESVDSFNDPKLSDSFSTSLYADVRTSNTKKKSNATIKKIGFSEMSALSDNEFEIGEQAWFDISLDDKILSIDAEIITKTLANKGYQYGFKFVYNNIETKKRIMSSFRMLLNEFEQGIRDLNK